MINVCWGVSNSPMPAPEPIQAHAAPVTVQRWEESLQSEKHQSCVGMLKDNLALRHMETKRGRVSHT